jgi:hypothetical protein
MKTILCNKFFCLSSVNSVNKRLPVISKQIAAQVGKRHQPFPILPSSIKYYSSSRLISNSPKWPAKTLQDIENEKEDKFLLKEGQSITHRMKCFFKPKLKLSKLPAFVQVAPVIFTDLQHPLVEKYDFQFEEFIEGVIKVFPLVRKGILEFEDKFYYRIPNQASDLRAQSNSAPSNTASFSEESIPAESIFHPSFFKIYSVGIKELTPPVDPSTTVKVLSMEIEKMKVSVIDLGMASSESYDDELLTFKAVADSMVELIHRRPPGETRSTTESSLDLLATIRKEERYVPGSILATIDLTISHKEDMLVTQRSKAEVSAVVEEEQVKMIRKVKTRVVFQSCISGETPMDWQIIIMNNLDVKVEDSPTLTPSS